MRLPSSALLVGLVLACCSVDTPHRTSAGDRGVTPAKSSGSDALRVREPKFFGPGWEGKPLGPNFVIIPRSAWDQAIKSAERKQLRAPIELVKRAAEAASLANDLWSSGAFSEPLGDSRTFSATDILIVAEDPVTTSERRVMTTDFFFSAVGLSGTSPWVARNVSLALQPKNSGGGGRCCGPSMSGHQLEPVFDPKVAPPGCTPGPIARCDWGEITRAQPINQGTLRAEHGLPAIAMKMFGDQGQQYSFSMMPPLGGVASFRCEQVKPVCTIDTSGTDRGCGKTQNRDWGVT